jgi:6-pyruvoyltetrahydropterin/6-carboxytetrahydropterin synthase
MRRVLTKVKPQSEQAHQLSTQAKLPLLISYAYLRSERPENIERLLTHPFIELLLDSGAFTALNAGVEIKLDEYIQFCLKWKENLFGYMALDKLQDPATTTRNLHTMLEAGLKPIPVHVLGDDERRMDELFELSDWVALGGFRRPHRGPAPYTYIKKKMAWAKGRKVHWLGFTNKPVVEGFKPFSCDCSSWMAGAMYGRVAIYIGLGRWITFTREEMLKQRIYLKGLPDGHPCGEMHGHSYRVEIVLQSEMLNEFCFVVDYNELKVLGDHLDNLYDHKVLNHVVAQPTAENIARELYRFCKSRWVETVAVRVSETQKTWATYSEGGIDEIL